MRKTTQRKNNRAWALCLAAFVGLHATSASAQSDPNYDEKPIPSALTLLIADDGNANEGAENLMDGNRTNKWCARFDQATVIGGGGWDAIFVADEPVTPRYYELVTANDTEGYSGRNWKTWKIYGANFDDAEVATLETDDQDARKEAANALLASEKWVLLDSREGDASLPAANFRSTPFIVNQEFEGQFKYIRIELTEIRDGETMQMSELTLLNDGNIKEQRETYYEQFSAFDTDVLAQKSLLTDYQTKLEALKEAADIVTLINLVNDLTSLQTQITSSVEAYAFYVETVNKVMEDAIYREEEEFYFLKGYLQGKVEPGFGYPNGSYEYILETALLNNSEIQTEAYYVNNLYSSALNGAYIPLSGSTDNFGVNEGYSALVDGDVNTKWGRYGAQAYTIFMTPAPQKPNFYTLTTANDTQSYPGRNWKSWRIYGANFASVSEAVRDAEEWVLIDEKTGIGQDRLGAANFTPFHFGFSGEVGEYRFYKIETLECYRDDAIQMSEFKFGDENDYETVRTELYDVLSSFEYEDVPAQISLLESYGEGLESLLQIETMEELQTKRVYMENLQAQIATSLDIYSDYTRLKNEIAATLAENPGISGEKYDLLKSYLEGDIEPSAELANGSYKYIMTERLLDVEGVKAEMKTLEALYKAAIEGGYAAGAEITGLIINPKFYYGTEGWTVEGDVSTGGVKTLMTAARAYNSKFDLNQTITGLKDGVYELVANGVFRCTPNGENPSYIATLYANDNQVYLKNIFDDYLPTASAEDLVNAYFADDTQLVRDTEEGVSEEYGYAPNSLTGMSYHFADGRYENRIMVTVKDGTLTIGIKNPGSGNTNDMTGFSNFRLFYRGTADEASAQASEVIKGMADRANTLLEYEPTGDIQQYPNFSNEHRDDLKAALEEVEKATSGQAKQELITRFSDIFGDIYESRIAYRAYAIELERYLQGVIRMMDSGVDVGADGERGMQQATDEQDALLSGTCSTDDAKAQVLLKNLPFYEDALNLIPIRENGAYQIGTAQQLVWFAEHADKPNAEGGTSTANVELTADIDLNDITTEGNNWNVMSTSYIYQGTFDGKGHKIYNLRTTQAFIWAFRGDLKNITISGDLLGGGNNFDGLIGWSYESNNSRGVSIIENVVSDINIDATKSSNLQAVGGIVGYAQTANLIINRCAFTGTITISQSNYLGYGGIVGYNGSGGTKISNCANYGTLTTDYYNTYLGGIMGYTNAGTNTFYNNINVGKVENTSGESSNYISALIGRHRSHSETYYGNNYWLTGSCTQATGENPIQEENVFEVSAEQLASGEVTYKLNQYAGETVWYQTLESDPYPSLDGTHKIVLVKEDGTYYNLGGNSIQVTPAAIATTTGVGIYDLQGRLVRTSADKDSALKGLPAGIYVVREGSQARKVLKK